MATKKAATPRKAPGGKKAAPRKKASPPKETGLPDRIYGIASPRSVGGISMLEFGAAAEPSTVGNFASQPETISRAVNLLQDAGFDVLQITGLSINIAGSAQTYERAFGTTLVSRDLPTRKERGREDVATFLDSDDTEMRGLIRTDGTRYEDVLEGVALEEPRYLMSPLPFPPAKAYWHLDVPGDVSVGCNADRAHRSGITGTGVRVAMVDSGWYRHPYFEARGYRVAPVTLGPATSNPLDDEIGHGTGESANLLAVAPDIELLPVKALLAGSENTVMVNSTGAFNAAVGLMPHIITNSWGFDFEFGPLSAASQALAAAVAAAVSAGIVVVFSAGNGHWGFPGQHPDVISAGGVFMGPDASLRASDYSSGFVSNIYPSRRVPDVSGLVGMQPGAQYILLPVQEGDSLDSGLAGGSHPNGDETPANDGWAAFSGTSAAAPMVAGAAALVKQACGHLTPAEVRDILMRTARDVTAGTNHPRFGAAATAGPDTATGNGLVDAHRAVLLARVRCISTPLPPVIPIPPVQPVQPLQPLRPIPPVLPVQPVRPLLPVLPLQPVQPVRPLLPVLPLQPVQPLKPIQPIGPFDPKPSPGGGGGLHLSERDQEELERMILEGPDDLL